MERDEYDDLLRRLTALIVKLDERDDQFELRFNQHEAIMARLDASIVRLDATVAELKDFNRQQLSINADLKNLLERAWRSSANGHTD